MQEKARFNCDHAKTLQLISREVVDSPPLDIFKTQLDVVLTTLLWLSLFWAEGIGADEPQRCLPTLPVSSVLWCSCSPAHISTCPPGSYSLSWFDAVKVYALHAWTADVLYTHPQAILITPPDFRLSVQFNQQRCFYVFPDHWWKH